MKKRALLAALALGIAASMPLAAAGFSNYSKPGRVYNERGAYEGRMDADGRKYDRSGRYLGREDTNGRRYDRTGRYRGETR